MIFPRRRRLGSLGGGSLGGCCRALTERGDYDQQAADAVYRFMLRIRDSRRWPAVRPTVAVTAAAGYSADKLMARCQLALDAHFCIFPVYLPRNVAAACHRHDAAAMTRWAHFDYYRRAALV